MRKLLFTCAFVITTVLLFVGCQKNAPTGSDSVITLNLWDIFVTAEEERIIKPAIEKWNEMHPTIKVVRDSLKDQPYRTKIATAVAANEHPDIFLGWAGSQVDPFIQAGKVLELSPYLNQETLHKAKPGVLANVERKGGIYGLPFAVWTGVLYCNEEMFKDAGLELPETYTDFLNCIDVFKSKGIGALATSGEAWVAMFYHNILALKTAGSIASNEALSGERPYDTPDFVEAANLLENIVKTDSFNNGYMGMDYDGVQAMFLAGQIPMFYMGNWLTGDCESDDSSVKGKIKAINFPYIVGKEEFKHDGLGGAVDSFFVSANTKHPKEATMFLEYLVNELSYGGAQIGRNFPAYKHNRVIDQSKMSDLSKQVADIASKRTGYTLAWDTILPGKAKEVHLNAVLEVYAGVITGQEFSDKMQTIYEQ